MLALERIFWTVLAVLLCVTGFVAPILVDARHWWPRNTKRPR
jgi:hypothetical protein